MMRLRLRKSVDKIFTSLAGLTVVLLIVLLVSILGPMFIKGSSAVYFDGTVEFRKMQMSLFNRGDAEKLDNEISKAAPYRDKLYEIIDEFKISQQGVDVEQLKEQIRGIYKDYSQSLKNSDMTSDSYTRIRSAIRGLRNNLEDALDADNNAQAMEELEKVLTAKDSADFKGTPVEMYFEIAQNYKNVLEKIDLSKRAVYIEQTDEISGYVRELFGPRPDEPTPALAENQFGATRMDMAGKLLDKIFFQETWKPVDGKKSVKVKTQRAEIFAGTRMIEFFEYLKANVDNALTPEKTFYWQYFIDDSTPGHYFGGVGPEILGTVIITVISMIFAVPLGIISAGWLVECAPDNWVVRIIRMCINTLAGVPSIVFGLFGLAFFVLFLFPLLGFESKPCILAASLTLSILTLPVMIRASEEAIRSVPRTYKEASLGLGAGRFHTFVKVILPSAMPGILTGVILSLSRVAGETAPILFTGAVALGPIPDFSSGKMGWLFQPTRALSYGSYDIAVGDRIGMMVPHNQFGMVVTLIMLILVLNAFSIVLRTKISRKLKSQ